MPQLSTGHIFMSYSRRDDVAMRRIVVFLRNKGIKVWVDNEKLIPGTPIWEEEIEKSIKNASAIVAVLSPDSKSSEWVRREVSLADQYRKRVFPVLVQGDEESAITLRLTNRQYVDIRVNEEAGLNSLSTALLLYLEELGTPVQEDNEARESREEPKTEDLKAVHKKENHARGNDEIYNHSRKTTEEAMQTILSKLKIPAAILMIVFLGYFIWQRISLRTPTTSVETTTLPAFGIGSTKVSDKDGMTLVYVPAGEFTMGSDTYPNEQPIHTIYLDAFWIDQTEVTNKMYAKCVDAHKCTPPSITDQFFDPSYANHPVVYVDWNKANGYCSWAERRLPTEAEWEKAARGTDERTYPWGKEIECNKANYNNCVGDTSPVGNYESGKSPYGAYDMAGNVWEWVKSIYKPYPYNTNDGRENINSTDGRVIRGGSWMYEDVIVRSAKRDWGNLKSTDFSIGFRCASSP
jgi:formylglycine-generating enzyme required for sulfatase activity